MLGWISGVWCLGCCFGHPANPCPQVRGTWDTRIVLGLRRANTGVSPLRCASVEMTGLRCGCAFGCEPISPSARDMGHPGFVLRWKRANTGVSPLRCASVEMTGLRCGCAFGCELRSPKARDLGHPRCAALEESQYGDLSTTAQKRASGRDDKGRSGWRRTVASRCRII